MTVPGSTNPLLAYKSSAATYTVSRSLRFNSADSARLSRTPASSGNRKTWTWSAWVKRSKISDYQVPIAAGVVGSTPRTYLRFDNTDNIRLQNDSGFLYVTTAVYRDPGAWMHLVWAVDTTNATAADRVKLYVNGTQVTSFSTATTAALNEDTLFNSTSHTAYIGSENRSLYYLDGYLANVEFIDGQALTPSSFAETNATTGQWVPKTFSGSYGSQGYKLTFSDNSNTTAATLGADTSGNGNNWTPSGFVVTAGAGNDSLTDTPTSYGTGNSGGDVRGNYCTWNPLKSTGTITNGGLDATYASTTGIVTGTFAVSSGKWYWEITPNDSDNMLGILSSSVNAGGSYPLENTGGWGYYGANGRKYPGASVYGSSYTAGDVIGFALDMDAGTLVCYKNGVSQGTLTSGLTGAWSPAAEAGAAGTYSSSANFGQRAFAYPVSGFKALCDTNLTAPTIAKPNTVMDVVTYTGTGSSQTISGLGFSPDLVYVKRRSATESPSLYDTVRGAEKELITDSAWVETTESTGLTAFTSDGFTVVSRAAVNASSSTYVAWAWDAGSSNASNTSGSISSTVRANTSAGFSIVTYTGTGANATVGHNLGVAPSFIVVRNRSSAQDTYVQHSSLGATKTLYLNTTSASATLTSTWNNTSPTSTVFSLGTNSGTNGSGNNMVAYCWTPVAGLSSFGQYTGNGSSDGPYIHLGFRAAVIIVKMSSSTGNWTILDDKREGYNVDNDPLYPNLSSVEGTADLIDITSNGFKVRTTDATFNTSSGTYIYAAWASAPFPYARAR